MTLAFLDRRCGIDAVERTTRGISVRFHGAAAAGAALLVALSGRSAFAEAPRRTEPLSDAEVARRISFVEGRLRKDEHDGRLWWTAWFIGYTGLTVGQAAFALATTDRGLRIDQAVGAVSSSIGDVGLALFPVGFGSPIAPLLRLPERTVAERRAKLARLERRLDRNAREEASGRAWYSHVLSAAVSVASGVVLAVAYDRVTPGIINMVSGMAIGEIQIWTQPMVAVDTQNALGQVGVSF